MAELDKLRAEIIEKIQLIDDKELLIELLELITNLSKNELNESKEAQYAKIVSDNKNFKPMTIEELNSRIDKSEEDFANGRFYTSEEVLKKFRL